MSFDLRQFLKRTPLDSLKAYFDSCCEDLVADVCWSEPTNKRVDRLIAFLANLETARRTKIWSDFERVAQFENETGRKALRSVISPDGELVSALEGMEDTHACGLHVLRIDPISFDRALAVHYATRLRNGRDWSGTELIGKNPIVLIEGIEALDALRSRLIEIFHAELGVRRRLKIESFSRKDTDSVTGDMQELVQFTVYAEGLPLTTMVFDQDTEVVRQTIHPVIEAAIVLDSRERTLEITGKGGKDVAYSWRPPLLKPCSTAQLRLRSVFGEHSI